MGKISQLIELVTVERIQLRRETWEKIIAITAVKELIGQDIAEQKNNAALEDELKPPRVFKGNKVVVDSNDGQAKVQTAPILKDQQKQSQQDNEEECLLADDEADKTALKRKAHIKRPNKSSFEGKKESNDAENSLLKPNKTSKMEEKCKPCYNARDFASYVLKHADEEEQYECSEDFFANMKKGYNIMIGKAKKALKQKSNDFGVPARKRVKHSTQNTSHEMNSVKSNISQRNNSNIEGPKLATCQQSKKEQKRLLLQQLQQLEENSDESVDIK